MNHPGPEPRPDGPPLREPRPFAVHWLVDAAIAFLAVVVPALLLALPIVPLAGAALLVGLAVAPITRRKEAEGLAARAARRGEGRPPA